MLSHGCVVVVFVFLSVFLKSFCNDDDDDDDEDFSTFERQLTMSTNALFFSQSGHDTFYYRSVLPRRNGRRVHAIREKIPPKRDQNHHRIHALLFFVDGLPFTACLVGGASQIAYSRLLKRYPFIEVQTVEFAASVAMLILTHVYWMRYFREERYSTEYAMGFFLWHDVVGAVWVFHFLGGKRKRVTRKHEWNWGWSRSGNRGYWWEWRVMSGIDGNSREKKRNNVVLQILDWVKMKWEMLVRVVFLEVCKRRIRADCTRTDNVQILYV